jgi:hypothetical protein
VFDGGAESVLQQLGNDVLEVHRHEGKCGFGLAVNKELGADAISQLTNVGNKASARLNDVCGLENGIYDANVRVLFKCRVLGRVRLAAKVQGNMLLGDETGADTSAKMLIQKSGYF